MRRNSVGDQGPELCSKSTDTWARSSTGRGIILRGTVWTETWEGARRERVGGSLWSYGSIRGMMAGGRRRRKRMGDGGSTEDEAKQLMEFPFSEVPSQNVADFFRLETTPRTVGVGRRERKKGRGLARTPAQAGCSARRGGPARWPAVQAQTAAHQHQIFDAPTNEASDTHCA